MPDANTSSRPVPEIPLAGRKIRLLIDTDAGCEIDDQYAIALAVLSPERFDIEGFVSVQWGSPDTLDRTVREIETVLEKAGMAGKYPVRRGSDPIQYIDFPEESEGVDFIIERAMAGDAENPLFVVGLGAATNIACAYMKEPQIADRVIVVWHGRSRWPVSCFNANAWMDIKAVRNIYKSDLPLVLFDTGTYIRWPIEVSEEKIRPHGPLGEYLHGIRASAPHFRSPTKGFFDLGDVAFLVDPSLAEWEITAAPSVRPADNSYDFSRTHGSMMRVYHVSRDGTFELLHRALARAFPASDQG